MLAVLSLAGCSKDETTVDVPENSIVVRKLTGSWILIHAGGKDLPESGISLTFSNTGEVSYFATVNQDGVEHVNKTSTQYTLENDWSYSEGETIQGHIVFLGLSLEPSFDGNERFGCQIESDNMLLYPDMGGYYLIDPTMKFKKAPNIFNNFIKKG
jgi:hypothetical protein